jgi:phosphate transport system substrate-binding protein
VAWATDTQAGNKNAGVAQVVTQTDGAIGYVDYSDAKAAKLDMASVENKAGKAIAPSTAGCQAAAEGSTVAANLTLLPLDAEGDGAYPVCAPTYVLAYKSQTDKAKGAILKAYLSFVLTDGQKLAESLNFAPLPKDLAKKAIDQIDQLTVAAS